MSPTLLFSALYSPPPCKTTDAVPRFRKLWVTSLPSTQSVVVSKRRLFDEYAVMSFAVSYGPVFMRLLLLFSSTDHLKYLATGLPTKRSSPSGYSKVIRYFIGVRFPIEESPKYFVITKSSLLMEDSSVIFVRVYPETLPIVESSKSLSDADTPAAWTKAPLSNNENCKHNKRLLYFSINTLN